ncbi:MAG: HPr family phosphocarrier protein [Treponema sp.]|jgi:phosphotransferase system HPr (HPr) family protein|nr:HPr family phosphocarrier protein [Treponema sp.]
MVSFKYTLKVEEGLHARPAGRFAKKAQEYAEDIIVKKGDMSSSAKRLFSVINLKARAGDEIEITVSGDNEERVAKEMEEYCASSL